MLIKFYNNEFNPREIARGTQSPHSLKNISPGEKVYLYSIFLSIITSCLIPFLVGVVLFLLAFTFFVLTIISRNPCGNEVTQTGGTEKFQMRNFEECEILNFGE